MKNYYEVPETSDGRFRARVYDENGATVYLSGDTFETESEAEVEAVHWADQNGIDVELG